MNKKERKSKQKKKKRMTDYLKLDFVGFLPLQL